MHKTVFLFLTLFFSTSIFCSTLSFKKDGKLIKKISLENFKKGTLSINDISIKAIEKDLYNAWRQYRRKYIGYDFDTIMRAIYGKDWKSNAKTITFVATDGYSPSSDVMKMVKIMEGRNGLISFKELNKDGFSKFKRGKKLVDPGPFYLVWSNFSDGDKATYGDILKWPYQLAIIDLKFTP